MRFLSDILAKAGLVVDGVTQLNTVANATTDTDKFLVSDGGVVKYRTGAELASDIGPGNLSVSTVKHLVKLGVAATKGQAVYVSSADGTNMIVSKASNASEATSSKTMGLLETGGAINDQVYVITEGLLAGLDTSTTTAGAPVWLGTDGNLLFGLANKPVAPAHLVFIGIVTRVQQNNGEIFVKVQNGFELEEIHNVSITGTPVDKSVLQYDLATSLWKNSTLAGVTASTGTAGQVAYFTGATTQAGSNDLVWNNTSKQLSLRRDGGVTTDGMYFLQSSNQFTNIVGSSQTPQFSIYATVATASGAVAQIPNLASIGFVTNISGINVVLGNTSSTAGGGVRYYSSLNGDSHSHRWYHNQAEQMRLWHTTGNLAIGGTFSGDSGQRLQVTGDTLLRGSGNTSGSTALRVQNSDTLQLFQILNNGNVGIGDASLAGYTLNVGKNITGSIISAGIWQNGSVLADVTTNAIGIYNLLRIQASTAISSYQHFRAEQAAFGAGATLGTQIGFIVENSLTGATNNYGFFGNLAAATGRWNLYMNGTADNYMAGSLGIGSTTLTGINLRLSKTITGATSSYGILNDGVIQPDVTSIAAYNRIVMSKAAGATTSIVVGYWAVQGTYSGTVDTQYGYLVDSTLTGATNNYAYFSNIASGTGRWNLYMNGTANNYLAGDTLIGSSTISAGNEKLQVTGATKITGNITGGGIISAATEFRLNNATFGRIAKLDNGGGFAGGYNLDYSPTTVVTHAETGAIAGYRYSSSGSMFFFTGTSQAAGTTATVRMTLDGSGNLAVDTNTLFVDATNNRVGINNATPTRALHVIGDAIIQSSSTGNGTTAIMVNNSSGTQVLAIGAAGGIIMNNSAKISTIVDPTSIQPQLELYNGGTGYTTLQSSTSYALLLNPSGGNVGIGTTSPVSRLSIAGTGGADGVTLTLMNGGSILAQNDPLGIIDFYSNDISVGAAGSRGNIALRNEFGGHWDGNLTRENTYFSFSTSSSRTVSEKMRIASSGAIRFNSYGTGVNTGTVAYNLAVDASGNIIETAGGVVDGSGTTNYVPKWSDPNTLTNSLIFDNGTNIGINSTVPLAPVTIHNATANTSILELRGGGGSSQSRLLFSYGNSTSQTDQNAILIASSTEFGISALGSRSITFNTNTTEKMRLDASGNLGLGVVPSAWSTSVKAIQVGLSASIAARTPGSGFYFSDNLYMSADPAAAPNGIYLYSAAAATYRIAGGSHTWYNAPSGTAGNAITFTQAMTLDTSGNLGLGVTPSGWAASRTKIEFSSAGTTAGFVGCFAGSSANNQMGLGSNAYYNTSAVWTYSNTGGGAGYYGILNNIHQWHIAPSGTAGNAITFTQAMTLDASGNLLVGGTSVYGATITSYGTATRSGGIGIRNSAGTIAGFYGTYAAGSGSGSTDILVESTGFMLFSAAGAERMRLTATNGNLHIGTFSADSGEKLQVTGTAKITGATSFGDNVTISKNYDGETKLTISNTTSGGSSIAYISFVSSNGLLNIGKRSATQGVYKILAVNDSQIFNNTAGDIAILNDFATGNIKFAAGGSSTAQMTLTSGGNLAVDTNTLFVDATNKRVGISATPLYKLHVRPVANANFGVRNAADFNASFTGTAIGSFNDANNANTNLYLESSQLGLNLQSGQNVLIGGNLLIGSTTDTTEKLQVTGTMKITGASTFGSTITIARGQDAFVTNLNINSGITPVSAFQINTDQPNTRSVITSRNGYSLALATGDTNRVFIDTSGNVGINAATINASAKLQIDSTTQGFLAPRMTAAQRAAITSPAVGLVVYQTDGTEGLWLYTSANGWKALAIVT